MAISLKKLRSSSYRETIYLGRNQSHKAKEEAHPNNINNNKWAWHRLWRRISREKKKIFSSVPVTLQASYDPQEYHQNFDHGTGWTEPDNLSRSFSARFADPSVSKLIKNSSVRYVRGV
ncbi:conserved hypothetical protein [Ricinus communis]|uniref:Uncharacterized protein n=1 Tax=Ricinus communis TaxID=3988 RepID=B9RS66_RICCO|nr:conserved hypothetical protein [Ricinus communis]|eukprot:XP_002516585.1 uncharacterized protein LOC8271225 [Ricinus communis]